MNRQLSLDTMTIPTCSAHLKTPQQRSYYEVAEAIASGSNVCFQSPTGSGKTTLAADWVRWGADAFGGAIFYVNRKALVTQTKERFESLGLTVGVRASEHDEAFDHRATVQVASADTERVRVYGDKASWSRFNAGLVIVDEAHIQKGETMRDIVNDHVAHGARVILMTATPIGLSQFMPNIRLVVAGKMKEWRDCGLLVPAVCKSIEQPDLSKVKRSVTGEFVIDGRERKIYTQQIVGNVLDRWKRYNPDARPTLLYAPGKAESVWFCEQFRNAGVPWIHVDATDAVIAGVRTKITRSVWEDILGQYRDGLVKGISSRFKLREGLDLPATYHVILATPIGSLASYLQTVGRGLRAAPDAGYEKDHCLITDHGGNFLRHGSANHDRPWEVLFGLSNAIASRLHENRIKNQEIKEPMRCPKCEGERTSGITCPHCGHVQEKSQRQVLMANGRLVTKDGDMIPKKRVKREKNTQELWDKLFWGYKKKKLKKSFSQIEAYFVHIHGYWPPRDLRNQPVNEVDWYRHVHMVPSDDLR